MNKYLLGGGSHEDENLQGTLKSHQDSSFALCNQATEVVATSLRVMQSRLLLAPWGFACIFSLFMDNLKGVFEGESRETNHKKEG